MRMNSFQSFLCKLLFVLALTLLSSPFHAIYVENSGQQSPVIKSTAIKNMVPVVHSNPNHAIPTVVKILIIITVLIFTIVYDFYIYWKHQSDIYKELLRQWLEPNKYRSTYVAQRTLTSIKSIQEGYTWRSTIIRTLSQQSIRTRIISAPNASLNQS